MTQVSPPAPLAADFAEATREQWRALVAAVLAKSGAPFDDPEQALASSTYDGYELRPLYTADDQPAGFDWATPGRRPSTGTGWDVRQRHTGADAKRVNQAVRADLENGVTSIWLTLGDGGLAVGDLAAALDGVYLDLAPVVLAAGAAGPAAARALIALAADQGVTSELGGSLGLDPIGVRARTGAAADLGELAEIALLARTHPALAAITIDGTAYHEAGGSDAQELAIVAAVAVAYLGALTEAGLSERDAFGLIECRYAVTADQFASIAKLRAARRIWSRLAELCGLPSTAPGSAQRQHAVTSRAMLTRRDPWVNLLRATVACFAAATAGADAITVEPFDAAIGQSDEFSRRIARNTQSILHDESSLARVSDPAAGSWYVEDRTDRLAHSAWDIFTGLERAGGALAALDSGLIPHLLAGTRLRRADAIAHRREAITGVSEFADIDEQPVLREPLPPAVYPSLLPSIRYAQDFESLRDRADAAVRRPRVFLAALGSRGSYTGRVSFASNLFQAGGIEPVSGTGELDAIVAAFTAAATTVACLCSSDSVYADQAGPVAAALIAAGATHVWLAGSPGERAVADAAAGVSGYLYAGCNALDVLNQTMAEVAR
jgi:methylmalonyl-CoA mutase